MCSESTLLKKRTTCVASRRRSIAWYTHLELETKARPFVCRQYSTPRQPASGLCTHKPAMNVTLLSAGLCTVRQPSSLGHTPFFWHRVPSHRTSDPMIKVMKVPLTPSCSKTRLLQAGIPRKKLAVLLCGTVVNYPLVLGMNHAKLHKNKMRQ